MKLEPGQRIRRLRELRGLSLGACATQAGLHKSSLSRIENGKQDIRHDELIRLSRVLGESCDEILGVEVAAPPEAA